VPHALLPARDAVGEERAHERHAKARAVTERIVNLARCGHAVVHQPQRLAPLRLEQPIGDEAVDLRPHEEWVHADAGKPRARAL
jgi:hypothetical protein